MTRGMGPAVTAARLCGAILWFCAILFPLAGLVAVVLTGPAPSAGWWFTSRQITLLGKSASLAGAAAVLSLLLALPAVRGLGGFAGRGRDRWALPALALPLLLPPYVYVFGWDGLVPSSVVEGLGGWWAWIRAAVIWAGWSWPIPALFLAVGWRRVGHGAYRAALLETSSVGAFRRAVLPMLAGHAAAAVAVLWAVFIIEYNVPHACLVQVFATELLAWGQASRHAVDVVYPSLLLMAVLIGVAGGGLAIWRGSAGQDDQQEPPPVDVGRRRWGPLWPVALTLCLTVGVPMAGLVGRLTSLASFADLWNVYAAELGESFAIAAGSGVGVVLVGMWLGGGGRWPRARRSAVAATILFGLMPAGLVGEAMVVTYRSVPVIYDQWPVMVLTQVARWGWIGWVTAWLVRRSASQELIDQARTDGADEGTAWASVGWGGHWPILAAGGMLAAAMCLAEVGAMSMVRPPGVGWMASTLMEKFHRFEDQMLVAISLVLMFAPLPAACLAGLAWRVRGRD